MNAQAQEIFFSQLFYPVELDRYNERTAGRDFCSTVIFQYLARSANDFIAYMSLHHWKRFYVYMASNISFNIKKKGIHVIV